jgi:hypothetical protein
MSEPRLNLSVSYDHASGLFSAHLENGACITFSKSDVTGRLQNTLTLFARGVINSSSGKWKQAPRERDFEYEYDESAVRRFSKSGEPIAPPLDLSFEELQ